MIESTTRTSPVGINVHGAGWGIEGAASLGVSTSNSNISIGYYYTSRYGYPCHCYCRINSTSSSNRSKINSITTGRHTNRTPVASVAPHTGATGISPSFGNTRSGFDLSGQYHTNYKNRQQKNHWRFF